MSPKKACSDDLKLFRPFMGRARQSMESVAKTAFWVAGVRAFETSSHDPRLRDPCAAQFLHGEGIAEYDALLREIRRHEVVFRLLTIPIVAIATIVAIFTGKFGNSMHQMCNFIKRSWSTQTGVERFHIDHIRRTLFIDSIISQSATRGVRQMVIFGCGLDTRAFRLNALSSMIVYEVDSPSLFIFKEPRVSIFSPRCLKRMAVPIEHSRLLEWRNALECIGFDPSKPSVYILEGLLMYLTSEDQGRLLASIPRCENSVVVGDAFDTGGLRLSTPTPSKLARVTIHGTTRDFVSRKLREFDKVECVDARSDVFGQPNLPYLPHVIFRWQRFFFVATTVR